jgi:hypothetical protein
LLKKGTQEGRNFVLVKSEPLLANTQPASDFTVYRSTSKNTWWLVGGSKDNTMDGWTVAGGSTLKPFHMSSVGDNDERLGFQFVNSSFLHNPVFHEHFWRGGGLVPPARLSDAQPAGTQQSYDWEGRMEL